jgi:HEAT repeat protein
MRTGTRMHMTKTTLMVVALALGTQAAATAQKTTPKERTRSETRVLSGSGLESLADLGSLASLGSLGSLGSLESLASLRSVASMASMSSMASLASMGSMASIASIGLDALDHLDALDEIGRVGRVGRIDRARRGFSRTLPPASWAPADPADSLWRVAHQAVREENYTRAAEVFRRIVERYPQSEYAPQSLYWQAWSLAKTGRSRDKSRALDALESLSEDYPKEAKSLSDAQVLKVRICGELAQRGDERCAAVIAEKAEPAASNGASGTARAQGRSCPRDDDDDERVAALNALLQMDSEAAVPILKRVLANRDDCTKVLRRKAVFLVSQKSASDAATVLLDVARNDPDGETREQAVFWLSQVNDPRADTFLKDILNAPQTDREIKNKALFALSQKSGGQVFLREYALKEGEPEELRGQAIFWLGQNRSEENATFLKQLFARTRSEELKDKILFSLSQQRGFGNEEFIMNLATSGDEDVEIRKKALFYAGQNSRTSAEQLVQLYDRIRGQEMREHMIFVLSQRRERAAVDKLMEIAKNDPDREMRKKALFWLGQSRDPRIVQFMLDIINKPN